MAAFGSFKGLRLHLYMFSASSQCMDKLYGSDWADELSCHKVAVQRRGHQLTYSLHACSSALAIAVIKQPQLMTSGPLQSLLRTVRTGAHRQ